MKFFKIIPVCIEFNQEWLEELLDPELEKYLVRKD